MKKLKKKTFILNWNIRSTEREDFDTIIKDKILVTITGNSIDKLKGLCEVKNITMEDLEKDIETLILSNFNKGKYYFKTWGYSGFDVIVAGILMKNWYSYDIIVPEHDEFWGYEWSDIDCKKFEKLKKWAVRVNVLLWWSYYDRNRVLAHYTNALFALDNPDLFGEWWTSSTIDMYSYEHGRDINIQKLQWPITNVDFILSKDYHENN